VNLLRIVGNRKNRQKAQKGKKFFAVLLMHEVTKRTKDFNRHSEIVQLFSALADVEEFKG
jgi:hypothetical protein